jgi:hypothetical protein
MTDLHLVVDVFPTGPAVDQVTTTVVPVASGATVPPYPAAGAVTPGPVPTVTAVDFTPSGIVAVASGAEGVELIVHPRP